MSDNMIGQEIEAYCGKCKHDTLHLITSLNDESVERVMCKICMSYHKYKKPTKATTEPLKKKNSDQTHKEEDNSFPPE